MVRHTLLCPLISSAGQELNQLFVLRRPLLLCLGLWDHSLDAMRSIIREVMAHPVW